MEAKYIENAMCKKALRNYMKDRLHKVALQGGWPSQTKAVNYRFYCPMSDKTRGPEEIFSLLFEGGLCQKNRGMYHQGEPRKMRICSADVRRPFSGDPYNSDNHDGK